MENSKGEIKLKDKKEIYGKKEEEATLQILQTAKDEFLTPRNQKYRGINRATLRSQKSSAKKRCYVHS